MIFENSRKLRDEPVPSADRLRGLQMLLDAEAMLLAEHGGNGFIKDGPIKSAAQTLGFARGWVASAYVREKAAEIRGTDIHTFESEMNAASIAAVEEFKKVPDKDISHAEMRSMDVIYREESTPPDDLLVIEKAEKQASHCDGSPF